MRAAQVDRIAGQGWRCVHGIVQAIRGEDFRLRAGQRTSHFCVTLQQRFYNLAFQRPGEPLVWRDPAEGGYGFMDSFSLDPPHGHDVNLGIDQGPLLLAIENARTGLIWRLFMQHEAAERSVERLGLKPR